MSRFMQYQLMAMLMATCAFSTRLLMTWATWVPLPFMVTLFSWSLLEGGLCVVDSLQELG